MKGNELFFQYNICIVAVAVVLELYCQTSPKMIDQENRKSRRISNNIKDKADPLLT